MATATITPDQNAVIAEIFIAAPPTRVFQAISDPAQLPKWWGQSGLYHVVKSTMDVRPGGKWRSYASALMARSSTLRANLLTSSLRDCRCTPGRVATVDRLPPSCAGNSRRKR